MSGFSFQIVSEMTRVSDSELEPDCFDELLKCLADLRAQTAERRRALRRERERAV